MIHFSGGFSCAVKCKPILTLFPMLNVHCLANFYNAGRKSLTFFFFSKIQFKFVWTITKLYLFRCDFYLKCIQIRKIVTTPTSSYVFVLLCLHSKSIEYCVRGVMKSTNNPCTHTLFDQTHGHQISFLHINIMMGLSQCSCCTLAEAIFLWAIFADTIWLECWLVLFLTMCTCYSCEIWNHSFKRKTMIFHFAKHARQRMEMGGGSE